MKPYQKKDYQSDNILKNSDDEVKHTSKTDGINQTENTFSQQTL